MHIGSVQRNNPDAVTSQIMLDYIVLNIINYSDRNCALEVQRAVDKERLCFHFTCAAEKFFMLSMAITRFP